MSRGRFASETNDHMEMHVQGFLLPGNTSRHGRNLLMGLRILLSSLLPGKTIESSGLAKAHGCSVIGVGRSGEFIGWVEWVMTSGRPDLDHGMELILQHGATLTGQGCSADMQTGWINPLV